MTGRTHESKNSRFTVVDLRFEAGRGDVGGNADIGYPLVTRLRKSYMVCGRISTTQIRALCLACVLSTLMLHTVAAQPADARIDSGVRLLSLDQPTALVADPLEAGFFYIVEAGKHRVLRVDATGTIIQAIGGPGSREGQFDTPQALDATNGTTLLVADTENGRVQGFSRAGAFLFAVPVGIDTEDSQRSYTERGSGGASITEGRPVAIVANDADDVLVVDGADAVIRWWDRDYRRQDPFGGYDAGAGRLMEPIALTLDDDQNMYVLDRAQQSIVLFDPLGTYLRHIGGGIVRDGRNLRLFDENLWVVLPHRLLLFETTGSLSKVFDVETKSALVDVYTRNEQVWLMTEDGLYMATLPVTLD